MISSARVQQDFTELNNESYVIEMKLQEYFRSRGYTVVDRANDKEYQAKDIDFEISMIGQRDIAVEVKADKQMYGTGNIIVEHGHKRPIKGRTKGWYFYCEADIICYHDTVNNVGYMIDWKKLKPLVREDYTCMSFKNPHDKGTITQGYLIPVIYLREKGLIIEEYSLN